MKNFKKKENQKMHFIMKSFHWCMVLVLTIILFCALTPVTSHAATEGKYTYKVSNGKATITKYKGSASNLEIPNKLGGVPVTAIGENAFGSCESLKNVTIPNSVIKIGREAFSCCESLEKISIGSSVAAFGEFVFDYCKSLKNISVEPNNPYFSSIEGVLFNKNKSTLILCPEGMSGKYKIPDNTTIIGNMAFYNCELLTSIAIPASITSIGNRAFQHCWHLSSMNIPKNVTTIGDSAFASCDSLTDLSVDKDNSSFSSIDGVLLDKMKSTLIRCPGGKSGMYTIPDGISTINNEAFSLCTKLTGISLPDSVTTIGKLAFANCWNAKDINIPKSITIIGEMAFSGCSELKSPVTIPDGVTAIGDQTFDGCYQLTKVTLGNSVKVIGKRAFGGCSLENLILPDSVESIGDYVFEDCFSLKYITIPNNVTSIGKAVFVLTDSPIMVIIQCKKDSYAQKYAEKNKISFKLLDTTIKYTVKFNKNYTKAKGSMKIQSFTYGMIKQLAKGKFKRAGYTFMGWNTKKNGKGTWYDDQAKIQTLTDKNGATITLYAQWLSVSRVGNVKGLTLMQIKSKTIIFSFTKVPSATQYQIVCATDKKFKHNKKVKTFKKPSGGLVGLEKGKTYYVKVRACKKTSTGKMIYSKKYSPIKKITIIQ